MKTQKNQKSKDNASQTGKRKCAIARVRLQRGDGKMIINGKPSDEYLGKNFAVRKKLQIPFEVTGTINKFDVTVRVRGGGKVGQANAIMYGIAKILAMQEPKNRTSLKAVGLITRDARIKERKKYGRKKARKRFQFSKR